MAPVPAAHLAGAAVGIAAAFLPPQLRSFKPRPAGSGSFSATANFPQAA